MKIVKEFPSVPIEEGSLMYRKAHVSGQSSARAWYKGAVGQGIVLRATGSSGA